jgi:hypothetical protein
MKIAETSGPKDFKPRVCEKFAGEIAVGLPYLRRRAKELPDLVQQHTEPVAKKIAAQGFDSTILSRYAEIILGRAKQVAASI